MKNCLKILNMRYLDYDGKQITVGGVQTYITNLSEVATELGMAVEVFQFANKDFVAQYGQVTVRGIKVDMRMSLAKKSDVLYKRCLQDFDEAKDLLLLGTDIIIPRCKVPNAIAVQHGIGWDIESEEPCSRLQNVIHSLRQCRRGLITTKMAAKVKKLICVDYNYINWYRTQILHREMDYCVIPNFTAVPAENVEKHQTDETIKIIFARRLVKYRGTRLFACAIARLLAEYNNLEITFAGDGPEEAYLRDMFADRQNIKFIKYTSDESLEIHRDKHIAVVPTVGSEGTSLSLLEAMAASCAVVCTNVGGMTNIAIDNFNGFIINPDEDQLYEAIKKLVDDKMLRARVARMAYATVQNGFSLEQWKQKWKKILTECE